MLPVLKNTYNYFETFKGRSLWALIGILFVTFLILGIFVGQFPSLIDGTDPVTNTTALKNEPSQILAVEKVGKVVYSDPSLFPNDNISYKLIDPDKGDFIIFLKASDDKLKVVEGAVIRLSGKVQKTADGKDVLFVEKIIFNR